MSFHNPNGLRRWALLGALLPAAALLGCQSGPSAAEVAKQYLQAQRQGDWVKFCQLLDTASVDALQRSIAADEGQEVKPCPLALRESKRRAPELRRQAQGVKIERLEKVNDRQELIVFRRGSSPFVGRMLISKQGAEWRVMLTPSSK